MSIVTLLTDFGLADTYVGQMKGVLLGLVPNATLVDLTHAVPPQGVRAGAFLLWSAVEAFSPGTVHLAVVDPGVGSARRAVALYTQRGHFLVGPDNGLLLPAARRLGGIRTAIALDRPAGASTTFHGRDIFAPAAARLAAGVALNNLGIALSDLVDEAQWPAPDGMRGEVIHVDLYGNLVTNVTGSALPPDFTVRVNDHIAPRAAYYAEVAPGSLLALVGSAGLLEISARAASAAELTGARRGTQIAVISRQPPPE